MNTNKNSYSDHKKSKLLQGILIGALTGAAISMLDRDTREVFLKTSKKSYIGTKNMIQNPNRVLSQVKETSNRLKTSIESISDDVSFISSKLQELKGIPPQVASVVKETKVALTDENNSIQDEIKI